MSDRAYLTLTIFDCPAAQARAVLDVLDEYGVGPEHADRDVALLHACEPYVHDEATLGAEDDIAKAIIAAAPQCVFRIWQDPKYEHDGQVVMYHPDLGRFDCGCDAFGDPHISLGVVDAALAHCGELIPHAAAGHLAAELHCRLGVPWTGAFDRCVEHAITPADTAGDDSNADGPCASTPGPDSRNPEDATS
jgi:hypothetical protein